MTEMRQVKAAPKNVEEYLASLPPDARRELEKIRRTIRSAAPGAVETFAYRMPAFKYKGHPLLYYAGFADHLSLFLATKSIVAALKKELAEFDASGGTIRFSVDKPLPPELVKRIVKIRIEQNEKRYSGKR